jgi:CRP-like cAMP-binding protein/galactitol-specific phosphotransferase system IIB component
MFQISEVLKKVPFFRTLGKESIDFIVERLKFKHFEEGETVVSIGEPGDCMYIIISGQVKVIIPKPDGGETIIAYLSSGDYFGEMALLTGEPRSASVITTQPSEMFMLHKNDFEIIVEKFPSISLSMGKIMSQRLRDTLQKAAKSDSKSAAPPQIKGSLEVRNLVDILKFCESNSLNGKVIVRKDGEEGVFEYKKGELQKVILGDKIDDEALDTMIGWTTGEFIIQPELMGAELGEVTTEEISEKPLIVLVNSSLVVQKVVQKAFESLGYDVYAVDNIKKASTMVSKMGPKFVIADTRFEDGDANDLVESLRKTYPGYIILLTDKKNRNQFEDLIAKDGHIELTKSMEVGELVKIAENIISGQS